jgi:hypothetical protein
MTVTRKQAEQVLENVKRRYRVMLESDGTYAPQPPQLFENLDFMGTGHPAPFAVVWKEGPYEWAYRFVNGGFDEELALTVGEYLGEEETRRRARAGCFTEEAFQDPEGVHVDCVTSWVLGIYEG